MVVRASLLAQVPCKLLSPGALPGLLLFGWLALVVERLVRLVRSVQQALHDAPGFIHLLILAGFGHHVITMKKQALEQAHNQLQEAKAIVEELRQSSNFREFSTAWSAFLIHANRVYTKLEAGSKSNAQSRQWFGRKKQERKTDQLLQYLRQARNSDEHGLEPVTEVVPGSLSLSSSAPVHIRSIVATPKGVTIASDQPDAIQLALTPTTAKLVRVFDDRSSRWYEPPAISPLEAAESVLTYLGALLAEAETLSPTA
jgi:hypothetical protein